MTPKSVPARAILTALCAFLIHSFFSAEAANLSIAWSPCFDPRTVGYHVHYGTQSGNYTTTITTDSTMTVLTGLTNGTPYYFSISAFDAGTNDGYPSPEVVIVPAAVSVPIIIDEPVSVSVDFGSNAALSVSVQPGSPVSYQWYFNGTMISGATGSTYVIPSVVARNSGSYTVVVSNGNGSTTSSTAVIKTMVAPVISNQLSPLYQGAGTQLTVAGMVSGSQPMTYQWYHGVTPIAGANSPSLTLSGISGIDGGVYYLTAANAAGVANAPMFMLTVTNLFGPVAGTYNGLFYQTNGALPNLTAPTAGLLGNFVVDTNGVYSGKVSLAGQSYPMAGIFNSLGAASVTVTRSGALSNLLVSLQLDMTGQSQTLSGSVSNMSAVNPWSSALLADIGTNSGVTAGSSILIIPAPTGQINGPHGMATLLTLPNGSVILAGSLFDGTQIVQTVPVSSQGIMPLYCSLYNGGGLLSGWLSLAGGTPSGTLTWIRPYGVNTPIPYPKGFTNVVKIN